MKDFLSPGIKHNDFSPIAQRSFQPDKGNRDTTKKYPGKEQQRQVPLG
jgi:hypothetical protein